MSDASDSLAGSSQLSDSNGGVTNSSKSDQFTERTDETASTESIRRELARRETEYIFKLRVLVILLLIFVAAGVSTLVFLITRNAEQEEFKTQFQGASQQILEAFDAIRTARISALSSVAVAAIAHGVDHKRSWPFVALSSFQERSLTARSNSGILQVSINPFVSDENRADWESYVVEEVDSAWIQEAYDYQNKTGVVDFIPDYGDNFNVGVESQSVAYVHPERHTRHHSPEESGPYLPYWEISPLLSNGDINVDLYADPKHGEYARRCLATGTVVLGQMETERQGGIKDSEPNSPTKRYSQLLSIASGKETDYLGDPMTSVYIPIFDSFRSDRVPKAVMAGIFNWAVFFAHILPQHVTGIDVVLDNHCFDSYTYRVNGGDVFPIGKGDLHETFFDDMEVLSDKLEDGTIADGTKSGLSFYEDNCFYTISIYPSTGFKETYESNTPTIITFAVAIIFAFAVAMFVVYDRLVERRQKVVLQKAVQSTAIVSSLFPKNVRDRLMQTSQAKEASADVKAFQHKKLNNFVIGRPDMPENHDSDQPIADLFPNCTVLFADISGFTAWSSTRDPSHVFTLLQSVYQAFDKIAAKRNVFKVETIGDSYVAVTGLPEPQESHAIIMAKFASDCVVKLNKVTHELEVILGPDTGDLSMRFGLHSGQVTAGVLRGDRARFQLFGDTVNTAARMESTGIPGKIQVSSSTAELLKNAGKESWIKPRADLVHAKGLGNVNTFWLDIYSKTETSDGASSREHTDEISRRQSTKDIKYNNMRNDRLIDWMTEILSDYAKKIVAKRISTGHDKRDTVNLTYRSPEGQTCLDEVVEALTLPKFDGKGLYDSNITLPTQAVAQLREYVSTIAAGYNHNPFHNFEHACHVAMSVHKLLKRVTTPDISEEDLVKAKLDSNHLAARLHDYTHGINSDPVTTFAIMVSALIHDVDHRGVSNVQMGKEEPEMAKHYKMKSIAEQNSLDIGWDLLMSKKFDGLRTCLFATKSELMRFRQALVNIVLATDIFDKELNDLRKGRWAKVFHTESGAVDADLRATIVLEHIMQASDVSHTMQHWHVYLKWNRRLFKEMTAAYKAGRMASDPAAFWYEGELKFFDNYIIPLAKKLKECQVFGVSSDEYLTYAQSNRMEWEEKGMSVVEGLKASCISE